MSHKILIIQPAAGKIPGLSETAAGLDVQLRFIKLWRKNITIPSSLSKYDGLIVLDTPKATQAGIAPCSANRIKEIVTKSLNEDRPYLGIGYGQNLLATHYGAVIDDNYKPSIGFTTGFITRKGREHPILKSLPSKFLIFKWHKRAIMPPMPADIDILASSRSCQFEAISIVGRPHLTGLQFTNNAASLKNIEAITARQQSTTNGRNWLSPEEVKNIPTIIDEAARLGGIATSHFVTIFVNFINIIKFHAADIDHSSPTLPHGIPAHGSLLQPFPDHSRTNQEITRDLPEHSRQ